MAARFTHAASSKSGLTFPRKSNLYAHNRPYLSAQDRPSIPYLGGPEDRLSSVFVSAYQGLADLLRTPTVQSGLAAALAQGRGPALAYVDGLVESAGEHFLTGARREMSPVVTTGAAVGRQQIPIDFEKGEAAVSTLRQLPQHRGGMARRPRPLPPFRELLRIPWRRGWAIPPSPVHDPFSNVPITILDAVDALTLDLVTMISETQRRNLVQIISEAVRRGYDADITGMRIARIIGLFPRWAQAVRNLEDRLLSSNLYPQHVVDQRVNDYSDWLRERRGMMIARTELMRGMNTGRLVGWHQQAEKGYFDPVRTVKEWSAAPGACDVCNRLNGQKVVGLDSAFDTDFGPVVTPPAHPHCRCTTVIHPVHSDSDPSSTEDTRRSSDDDSDSPESDAAVLNDPEMRRLLASMPS